MCGCQDCHCFRLHPGACSLHNPRPAILPRCPHLHAQQVVGQHLDGLHAALVAAELDQRLNVLRPVRLAGHHHVPQLQQAEGGSAGKGQAA